MSTTVATAVVAVERLIIAWIQCAMDPPSVPAAGPGEDERRVPLKADPGQRGVT
jgi:hypothetical protein